MQGPGPSITHHITGPGPSMMMGPVTSMMLTTGPVTGIMLAMGPATSITE